MPSPIFLLGNSTERGAWRATVHEVTKESNMTATKQQQQPLEGVGNIHSPSWWQQMSADSQTMSWILYWLAKKFVQDFLYDVKLSMGYPTIALTGGSTWARMIKDYHHRWSICFTSETVHAGTAICFPTLLQTVARESHGASKVLPPAIHKVALNRIITLKLQGKTPYTKTD